MRRFLFGRAGLAILGGLIIATSVGASSGAAGAANRGRTASANPPCNTASYSITVSSTMHADFSLSISGQVDFGAGAATANVTLPSSFPIPFLAGSTLQVVLVGGTAYVAVPPGLSSFVGGASWVSIGLPSNLNTSMDTLLGHLASFCGSPQSSLSSMATRRHAPKSLGTSSIGGVRVKGSHLNAQAKRFKKTFGLTTSNGVGNWTVGARPIPITEWVNAQGQLSEISINLPEISITINVTNIDQPVNITAPAGAVSLSPSFLNLLGGFPG